MHKLGITDASFLYMESPSNPMNIGSVQLLDVPTRIGFFNDLKQYLAQRIHAIAFMRKRLKSTPFTLDQPVWVDDPDFDIDNHVVRVQLSAPGTWQQLEALVARLHETVLPRARPLWAFYYIEGLATGQVAWFCKYHHACIDGMAGQAIIDVLFSRDPATDPPMAPLPEREPEPGALDLMFDAARSLLDQSLRFPSRLDDQRKALGRLAGRVLKGRDGLGALYGEAPRTPFNCAISPYRTWSAASLPLLEMKAVAKAQGTTLNDVVMASCAAGMRRYLLRNAALPPAPLRCGVPVSLRAPGDTSMRNQVTMLVASLATDVADPIERLQAIKASMNVGKGVVADTGALQPDDLHLPGLSTMMSTASLWAERFRVADYMAPMVNVVISNVRGPMKTMYLHGAKMCSHFPVSIPSHSIALNLTVQTYVDRVDLGVTACLEAVPDVADLRDDIVDGWQELKSLVLPKPVVQRDVRAA
ncbi:MAG TPA: wax ester/triacylglycerol synthase family O-acyltransferase [Pseudomonadales bacterium]|nr:wax ester/triacylglycerol synthase family O-acyltransferase [Pseudomonadales bacterium]